MSDIEFDGCVKHRGTLADPCPWCEIERLRAENDRLRGNLIDIGNYDCDCCPTECCVACDARRALEGEVSDE